MNRHSYALLASFLLACRPSQQVDPAPVAATSVLDASPVTAPLSAPSGVTPANARGPMPTPSAPVDPTTLASIAAGDRAFAASLYKATRAENPGNLFLSPASVRVALAMTLAGAKGDTEREMRATLALGASPRVHDAFATILQDWNGRAQVVVRPSMQEWERQRAERARIELHVVNRIWGQRGRPFRAAFLGTLSTSYGAPLEELDFIKATDASTDRINTWVAEQTEQKITNLIPRGLLNAGTRLVLTNAVYFKASWSSPFLGDLTKGGEFLAAGTKPVSARFMNATEHFPYAEVGAAQVLELPYGDGSMSMVVVLPNAKDGLAALESSLSATTLAGWAKALTGTRVRVALPKFKMSSSVGLAHVLGALGMKSAFTHGPADFSEIDGTRDLFISAVLHKAYVDVNEQGTEAAAATAVAMGAGGPPPAPPKEFKADHPFFFFIRDKKFDSVLFAGSVVDPTSGS